MRWAAPWRLAADEAGIQFRILNSRKGPAVRATRAQADRVLYRRAIRSRLENQPRLRIFQQAVDDLLLEGDRVSGVVTQIGLKFSARAVVLTTGTFLAGLIHVGLEELPGGTRRRSAGADARAAAARAEAAGGAAENRHAAAHRRPQHRFLGHDRAAGR